MAFPLIDTMIMGYCFSTLAFLILALLLSTARQRIPLYLNRANRIIIVVVLIKLLLSGIQAINCFTDQPGTTATGTGSSVYGVSCFYPFIFVLLCGFAFQLLFLNPRFRRSVGLSLISALLLLISVNYEKYIIVFTSVYRDYLPSSWNSAESWKNTFPTVFISIGYFCVCWYTGKSGKAPNPHVAN